MSNITIILDMDGTIILPFGAKNITLDSNNNIIPRENIKLHFNDGLINAIKYLADKYSVNVILLSNNYDVIVKYVADILFSNYKLKVHAYGLSDKLCPHAMNINTISLSPRIVKRCDLIDAMMQIHCTNIELNKCIVIDDRKENLVSVVDKVFSTVHIDINWIHTRVESQTYIDRIEKLINNISIYCDM